MKHTSNFLSRLSVRGIGRLRLRLSFLVLLACCASATAQTTAFTYQGKLADNNGNPLSGNYDFQFSLFDGLSGGAQLGTTQTATNILVTNGIFAVTLDFVNCSGCNCPTCFNGGPRFLEIAVKPTGGGSFTPLTPRQPVTSNPYAIKSLNAATSDGLSVACVSCVTSSQIATVNGSAVTGTIPVASVPAGSANYVQNQGALVQSGDFNISGNGTAGETLNANVVNATTQYNIGGARVFKYENVTANTYAGFLGNAALGGTHNSFFGGLAALGNTGTENSFFGYVAGGNNNTGDLNSFFGAHAGSQNSSGGANSFFGYNSGSSNQTARFNSFLGYAQQKLIEALRILVCAGNPQARLCK